ncbi:MAG: hypothetical protein D3924_16465 [Candidatus Electrothrix sp. AR4]|nr:hypothetical protein [Candidatus Electrothrix sp. AR4]
MEGVFETLSFRFNIENIFHTFYHPLPDKAIPVIDYSFSKNIICVFFNRRNVPQEYTRIFNKIVNIVFFEHKSIKLAKFKITINRSAASHQKDIHFILFSMNKAYPT